LTVYLRHNYIPAPYPIYEGIRKVRPATIVTVQADRSIRETPYWSLHEVAQRGLSEPMTDQVETIIDTVERQLRQTIKETMVADVPLGAFLSGGIDSSTVVALMQAESSRPVRTFTIGFHEAGYNEAEHAKAVARHLGTEHTELYLTQEEARTVIPRLPSLYDEPFADSSQIPTALVAQLTRRYVTVALSGDGGDEIFAGYNRYFLGRRIWRWIGSVPRGLRQVIAGRIQAVAPSTWDAVFRGLGHIGIRPRLTRPGNQVHKLADILAVGSEGEMYRRLVSHWRRPEQVVIGGTEWPSLLDQDPNLRGAGLIERMMYWDSLTYLPDDIMVKVDRATMGVSLESRAPFLDHRVVELAWRLPPTLRVRNNQGKWILRQVLHRHVPASLVDRPKMGFGVPIDGWLRGPLKEWAEDLLSADRLKQQGYFHPALIRQRWTEHANGLRNWQYHLWDILMFQAWLAERDSDVRPTPLTSQGVTTHA
jgi:asparagine synthase (glutamine-hydrolysing)